MTLHARLRLSCGLAAALALAACSSLHRDAQKSEPTLASLKPVPLPTHSQPLPQVGLQQVADSYRDVLHNASDPELRVQVTQRLADLQLLSSEQKQLAGKPQGHYYDDTIKAYRDLLAKYPNRPENDRLLYQLAKAYDLDGRGDDALATLRQLVREYPHSEYYIEAQFRCGEMLFARDDYAGAEAAYAEVVKKGRASHYYQNALYMQGWAQFKRGSYEPALVSFTGTLDLLWPAGESLDDLPRTQRELVDDALRVMSLIFSYDPLPGAKGAQTIAAFYKQHGERHYNAELYRQLGQLYLRQKRYRDAADTYRAYADTYPLSPLSPPMYVQVIAAFNEGNFPSEVLSGKAEFIDRYGIHSAYWAQADAPARAALRENLKPYLRELAQYHHAEAQRIKALIGKAPDTKGERAAAARLPTDDSGLAKASDAEKKAAAQKAYRLAGNYYREYIDTFPHDPEVGRIVFLLAESRFEAEDYAAAIEAYEQAAYQYADNERGADAGYSALLAYQQLIERLPAGAEGDAERDKWQQRKIASELRYAKQYARDPRAVVVQAHAADELFERKAYPAAVAAASVVLQWRPRAETRLLRSAAFIVGHGEFAQQHYAAAEQGYRTALSVMARDDKERPAIEDRLAASVYKQGEQKLAGGDKLAAAQQFLRAAQVAPGSKISISAQYDAATQFMDAKQWQSAIATLTDFRARYPKDPLSEGVAAKLAVAYQQSGQPAAAAAELTRVAHEDKDPAARREALYSAAELYQKAHDSNAAIARYDEYVKNYAQPFAPALEARYQLSELYEQTGDDAARKRTLKAIIAADATAGSERSDRSKFLAAQAQDEFAGEAYRSFVAVKLTLPLKQSLKQKKIALENALSAYKRCEDYGVQQFATKASYRIGEIYAKLSDDLIHSERPPGLSDLEKEQYELLLEEQSDPFVEKAIAVQEGNAQRIWKGIDDEWVQKSFKALEKLLPARYKKPETKMAVSDEIR